MPVYPDLQCHSRRWVTRLTPAGNTYGTWEWSPMPRINDDWLLTSIYIYPSKRAAKDGMQSGGSGCIVARPASIKGLHHFYAVTNSHVLVGEDAVIRVNVKGSKVDFIPTKTSVWARSEDADLAVHPMDVGEDVYDQVAIGTEWFINHGRIATKGMGHGDECFVIGRFINHDGKQRNKPTTRFGCISAMPDPNEGIFNKHIGKPMEAFLVECRTIPGYSGSPVFVHIPPGSVHRVKNEIQETKKPRGPWLLGLVCASLQTYEDVKQKRNLADTPYVSEMTTGMLLVVPAWHLTNLIENDPDLIEQRKLQEEKWKREMAGVKLHSVSENPSKARDEILGAMLSTPPQPRKPVAKRVRSK